MDPWTFLNYNKNRLEKRGAVSHVLTQKHLLDRTSNPTRIRRNRAISKTVYYGL